MYLHDSSILIAWLVEHWNGSPMVLDSSPGRAAHVSHLLKTGSSVVSMAGATSVNTCMSQWIDRSEQQAISY